MSLSAGTRLGSYEVIAAIGAGGMGEVYRARDVELGRDVAIKVLPDLFANDPERLARFEREAKTLAALNHPNIGQIYGMQRHRESSTPDGLPVSSLALVMELVDGPTLAEVITAAPEAESPGSRLRDRNAGPTRGGEAPRGLKIDDALKIAKQMALALEAAHEVGIIHRDLKPSNVKVRDDGTVKVLDFGLAKSVPATGALSPATMESPTVTAGEVATGSGVVLGTAAYMSPEQARGRPVDRRTDIWAFGVVLFEMLTGRRVFQDEDRSLTLSNVLRLEPDYALLPNDLPGRVSQVLRLCLRKDPRQRIGDIRDVRLALDGAFEIPAAAAPPSPVYARWLRPWPATVAALALVAGTAALVALAMSSAARESSTAAPWDTFAQLTDQSGEEVAPTLAPDGQTFAYASRSRGTWDIYAQRVGGRNPVLVAGDPARDEASPVFSPDGTTIAYHEADADGGIFLVGATGESPRRLTTVGFHPAWSPDGRQIAFGGEEVRSPYSRYSRSALFVVDVAGGEPRKIFDGDAVQPVWSPSGRRIAFWANRRGQRDLATIPATGGDPVFATDDAPLDWSPAWSPDGRSLIFASDRGGAMNLWRLPIDESTGRPLGDPESVTRGVEGTIARPALSRDGTRILFQAMWESANPVALAIDPGTEQLGMPRYLFRRTGILVPSSVSPDGEWLAFSNVGERHEDIFIARADGSGLAKLTDDVARDRGARWSPDGTELAFYSNRGGTYGVWMIGADGGQLRQVLSVPNTSLLQPIYSPSGDRIIANTGSTDLYSFDPRKPGTEPTRISVPLEPGASYTTNAWSPDGRLLAGIIQHSSGTRAALGLFSLDTRTITTLSDDVRNLADLRWLDARRVVTQGVDGSLAVRDVVSGRRRVLTLPAGLRLMPDALAMSPDGRTIYVSALERQANIWMVDQLSAAHGRE